MAVRRDLAVSSSQTNNAEPLNLDEFSDLLERFCGDILKEIKTVAVGVSGGPDSMTLAWLLQSWAGARNVNVHALTVDHGLRADSAKEAQAVAQWLKDWPAHINHHTFVWDSDIVQSRIQEQARQARYALMQDYCAQHEIKHLFLAHHMDDQAETFLFRLAKGSGLDGLAGMQIVQPRGGLNLVRPLLGVPKERLVATCESEGLPYIKDPSNESENFARVRMRGSWDVLQSEGLSSKRLAVTAQRIARARAALDVLTEDFFSSSAKIDTERISIDIEKMRKAPEELGLRAILKAVKTLNPDDGYGPRMEKVETLYADLMGPTAFRKRTLGGVIFKRDDQHGHLILTREEGR